MAKILNSAIGIDIGQHSMKSVLMQRKSGGRIALTHFASVPLEDTDTKKPDAIGEKIKRLLKEMGGSAKACAVTVSSADAMLRIVDQPEMPSEQLRDILKLNGSSILNQDCRNMVLDCSEITTTSPVEGAEFGTRMKRYLVAGLPREEVHAMSEAFDKGGLKNVISLQLAPVSIFNAFAYSQKEAFSGGTFFLLNLGYSNSTMLIGSKEELVLIRSIDFGAKNLADALSSLSGERMEIVMRLLEQDDEVMVENTRMALMSLTREIGSSIGFFEGRRDETISKIWVSGELSGSHSVLRVLAEELQMPCLAWNATQQCEINVGSSRQQRLEHEAPHLSMACGAAANLLQ